MKKINLKEIKNTASVIKSGIETLNNIINGYPIGVTVIGAVAGMGKTSYLIQEALNMASEKSPILLFQIETSPIVIYAKMIAMEMFRQFILNQDQYTEASLMTSDEILLSKERTQEQENAYQDAKKAVDEKCRYISFYTPDENGITVTDIITETEKYIAETGKKPIVMIDYLQVLKPDDNLNESDEKSVVSSNMSDLYNFAHRNNIAVIVISAFNRDNYNTRSNPASYRGSSSIEYAGDLCLALEFSSNDFLNCDWTRNPRKLNLAIIKNRTGMTGNNISLKFYPEYSYFTEDNDKPESVFSRFDIDEDFNELPF